MIWQKSGGFLTNFWLNPAHIQFYLNNGTNNLAIYTDTDIGFPANP